MIIQGLDEVIADLTRAEQSAQRNASEVVEQTARAIEETAWELAPKGHRFHEEERLADSIHTTLYGTSAEVGPSARHAPFVEDGTWKDDPQPFMGPSADQHLPSFVKRMENMGADI